MGSLYDYMRVPMDPSSEHAQRRYGAIKKFFDWALKEELVPRKRELRVLDLCAGTGIAGAALCETLHEWGIKGSLTLVDKRGEDLSLVKNWLSREEEVTGIVGDCLTELPKLRDFDVALLWGHSMAHFNPFQAAKLFRSVAEVLNPGGIFLIEETNNFERLFYRGRYRSPYVEVKSDEWALLSLDEGYSRKRDTITIGFYRIPNWELVERTELRFWDLAGIAGMLSMAFEKVGIVSKAEHGIVGVDDVVYALLPHRA
ncbi:SAM-dependent methyltransferase [Thermococcus guaymasensis DSM 11113]|uniref:SAM-dependent methyltransferase n=1 Tax=Thermococcus guaymasensis DSM 11113 TaxID=1432656 RepID=A0A0X1KM42_9EURY|nr:class I SAM-dependent methyltransferase [Thermococcus guaymasensis]AJC72332.1 SAM-dependent methyltransferase [Thermococcus guaymasensis DSM 11113]